MHHQPQNQERTLYLSIITVSGPGEFPRVSRPGRQLPDLQSPIPDSITPGLSGWNSPLHTMHYKPATWCLWIGFRIRDDICNPWKASMDQVSVEWYLGTLLNSSMLKIDRSMEKLDRMERRCKRWSSATGYQVMRLLSTHSAAISEMNIKVPCCVVVQVLCSRACMW